MKKLFGLMAVISLVACSDTSDPASALQNNTGAAPTSSETVLPADQSSAAVPPASSAAAVPQSIVDPKTGAQLVLFDADRLLYINSATGQIYNATLQNYVDPITGLPIVESSSAVAPASSAVAPTSSASAPASSATPVARSSSSKATPKSSAAVVAATTLELWDGAVGAPHVPVGNMDGGWWYGYNDADNKGASVLTWDVDPGDDGDMTPVVEACNGVCGSFELVQGGNTNDPFIGFAFGLGKNDKFSDDISKIGGICVEYTASSAMTVAIGLTHAREVAEGYDVPAFELDAATKPTVVDIAWASFKQQWTSPATLTGANAAKEASSIKFQIKDADGTTGTFSVTKVGPKGSCN